MCWAFLCAEFRRGAFSSTSIRRQYCRPLQPEDGIQSKSLIVAAFLQCHASPKPKLQKNDIRIMSDAHFCSEWHTDSDTDDATDMNFTQWTDSSVLTATVVHSLTGDPSCSPQTHMFSVVTASRRRDKIHPGAN
jgi:hypothetical protein